MVLQAEKDTEKQNQLKKTRKLSLSLLFDLSFTKDCRPPIKTDFFSQEEGKNGFF